MANTPNVRFEGFSGEWEERRLSEYLTVSTEKNKENIFDKTDVLSVSGDHGVVNQISGAFFRWRFRFKLWGRAYG